MSRLFFILLLYFFSTHAFSQSSPQIIEYDKLIKCKIDKDRFEGGGGFRHDLGNTPRFSDYTKARIQTQIKDPKKDSIIYTSPEPSTNGLIIKPNKIALDKESKLFQISGQITGGWEDVIPFEFGIYIGHRVDTVSNITLSPSLHGTVYYNGAKVDTTIVIDIVPAFYLTNFKKFSAYRGDKNLANSNYKEMLFDISAMIDEKSVLIFGLSSRYAEIFEVGKLLTKHN